MEIETTELVPLSSNVINKNSLKVNHIVNGKDGDNLFAYSGSYFSLWNPFFKWVYRWDSDIVDNSGDEDYNGFASLGITTSDKLMIQIQLKPLECKEEHDYDGDNDGKNDDVDGDDDNDGINDNEDKDSEGHDRSHDHDNDGKDDNDDDDDDNDEKKDNKDKHKLDKNKK